MEKNKHNKLRKEIKTFFEEFDKDSDNLYQEEISYLKNHKSKKRLKYPESFYDHWKQKMEEFILKRCVNHDKDEVVV